MKKLTKSATDRQVSGVLGGIAEYFGIDSTIIRVIFVILLISGAGSPVFLYFILAVLMPEPNQSNSSHTRNYSGNYRTGSSRPRKEAKPADDKKEKDTEDDWSDF